MCRQSDRRLLDLIGSPPLQSGISNKNCISVQNDDTLGALPALANIVKSGELLL